ncbi:MAG: rod shape-determining protein MreC [Patescibacteria group bacterium]
MIHQLRDKKQIARRKSLIRNAIIIGVFIILSVSGALGWSGKIFSFIGRPFWQAENIVVNGVSNSSYMVRTKSSVYRENESLKKENESLRLSMIDYQILKKENETLKELLGRLPENHTFTLANILAKPNRSLYDTIIIDIGNDLGLIGSEQVFAGNNSPIGQISAVYSKSSLVMLYSNPGQITEAVLDNSNATVELVGRGGGNFEMTIPNDLPSDVGMMVVLPGSNREIVAIIDGVISRPTGPLKKVILRSPVNIQSLKWVEVKRD